MLVFMLSLCLRVGIIKCSNKAHIKRFGDLNSWTFVTDKLGDLCHMLARKWLNLMEKYNIAYLTGKHQF